MDNNNNPHKLLTVKEFAERKGISLTSAYKWMRLGFFDDVRKIPGEPFLIPESYLSVCPVRKSQAVYLKKEKPPKLKRHLPTNLDESRERYNRRNGTRKIQLSFDELKDLFDQGKSLRDIGTRAGVSWQAISQVYARYFAPFTVANRERQHTFVRDRQIKKAEEHFLSIEKMSKLTEIVINLGFDVEPIVYSKLPTRCNTHRVIINDRLCGVYHLTSVASPAFYRTYYRINLSRTSASKFEFIILFTGDDLDRVFVIPSEIMADRYDPESKKNWKTFYIPTEKLPVYRNQYSRIDWWKYENRWDQLKREGEGDDR